MKKFFTFALVCCLVFSSSCIAFASPTQWDTSDRTLLSNIATTLTSTGTGTLLRSVNAILTALTSTTQQGSLYNGVAYLYDIRQYASQIASGLNGTNGSFLEKIFNALTHTDAAGIVYSYVTDIYQKVTEIDNTVLSMGSNISDIKTNTGNIYTKTNSIDTFLKTNYTAKLFPIWAGTGDNNIASYDFSVSGSWIDFLNNGIRLNAYNTFWGIHKLLVQGFSGYNANRSFLSWTDLSSNSFTPTSATNGIYTYLAGIQNPIARLAYVHASDEEIEARQKAEANQTAVVDNFIDPNGSGSLPTSSIGSVSDMSDSFKDNFSTDASPTGLFDIFNSDHGSWFSQETADQLDTTNINNRSLKAAPSDDFETPFLNQQIDEIYNALGVKK